MSLRRDGNRLLLATDAFFIFLMVRFFRGIPRELTEAATIDGAGHGRIFLQIMLPLSLPALATTAIFTFIWTSTRTPTARGVPCSRTRWCPWSRSS